MEFRIDDLQCNGLKIKQNPNGYCFTSDAVLLANSIRCGAGDTAVDFGCGNGVISLLLSAKTHCSRIIGLEIQKEVAILAQENVRLNGLEDKIDILNCDIKDAAKLLGKESVEVVVCNPPYFAQSSGEKRECEEIALSRHESTCDLKQIVTGASEILKYGGQFYMIHKTQRMAEAIAFCSQVSLIPKNLTLIYPRISKKADTFILRCKKCGKHSLDIDKLVIYDEEGNMTREARAMYGETFGK